VGWTTCLSPIVLQNSLRDELLQGIVYEDQNRNVKASIYNLFFGNSVYTKNQWKASVFCLGQCAFLVHVSSAKRKVLQKNRRVCLHTDSHQKICIFAPEVSPLKLELV